MLDRPLEDVRREYGLERIAPATGAA
jgi:hypothetical protein